MQEKEKSPIIGKEVGKIPDYMLKHLYTGDDTVYYEEILKFGFPTFQNAKRAFYKHKGINNWEEEKLEIPEYLKRQGQTGKFFKTGLKALPTGENVVVIDCDVEDNYPVGLKNLSEWLKKNKVYQQEFDTFKVKTTSGGVHLYYTYPSEYTIKSKAGEFLPHVDTRAEGGIIMMPGSQAKRKDESVGSYEIAKDSVSYIKPIPQKLLEAICEKPKDFKSKVTHVGEFTSTIPNAYKAKVQESIVSTVAMSAEGTRNHTLYSQSVKAGSYGLPYEETLQALLEASSLPSEEVESTFERGYAFGVESPAEIPEMKKKEVVGDTKVIKKIEQEFMEKYNIILKKYSVEDLKFFWHEVVLGLDFKYIMEESKFIQYDPKKGVWGRIQKNIVKDTFYEIQYGLKKYFDALEEVDKEVNFSQQKSFIAPKRFVEEGIDLLTSKMSISSQALDSNPDILVVKNGVLNLKTGTLSEFSKEALHTKASTYDYLSASDYETYDGYYKQRFKKIMSVLDDDTLKYLQVVFGQALTGYQTKTQKSYWLYSKGQSGKSTVLNLLGEVLREWTATPSGKMYNVKASGFTSGELFGKRLWLLEEAPVGYLDAGKLKGHVGTRFAQLERKGVDSTQEEVMWSLIFSTNALPELRKSENDIGTLRRIVIIPFLKRLTKEMEGFDATLEQAYEEREICELFLHWCVQGSMRWYSDTLAEESFSLEMLKVKQEWENKQNENSDPLQTFFTENITLNENTCITLDDLFSAYQDYCFNSNIHSKKTKLQFKREFEEKAGKVFEKKRPGKYEMVSSRWVRGIEDRKSCMKQKMFGIGYVDDTEINDTSYVN